MSEEKNDEKNEEKVAPLVAGAARVGAAAAKNPKVQQAAGNLIGGAVSGMMQKKSFDTAWSLMLKDMATATRSAELWAQNTESIYFTTINAIQSAVNMGESRDEVKTLLATKVLPAAMMDIEGFHEELSGYGEVDAMSDVDWEEVAEGFMDYYDDATENMA